MVEINIAYQGQLRCQAAHEPSGKTLETDAPVDNMGRGETFSPTDLVATALGTCILTILGIISQRHQIDLGAATVTVQKEMTKEPPRRIARLATTIRIPVAVSDDDRHRLENAAHTCPVCRSLHPEIETPITFQWG